MLRVGEGGGELKCQGSKFNEELCSLVLVSGERGLVVLKGLSHQENAGCQFDWRLGERIFSLQELRVTLFSILRS